MNVRSARGAALPETALSLTVMLAVLVGGLRLAIVGYEQVAVDGAAFYDAHETGVKTTYSAISTGLDPTAATKLVYPRTNSASVSINPTAPQPAPTVVVSTEYGSIKPQTVTAARRWSSRFSRCRWSPTAASIRCPPGRAAAFSP